MDNTNNRRTGRRQERPPTDHWSKERLHADMQRAVGGTFNLVRELSRISQMLDGTSSADRLVQRLRFFGYELQAAVDPKASLPERLAALNEFFFVQKRFRCITDFTVLDEPSDAYKLGVVMASRAGAPNVIALIYAFLAERMGVEMDFVDLKPTCFLRWNDEGRSRFVDITRSGTLLSSDELIEILHTRFRMTAFGHTNLLETYTFETFIVEYLHDLRRSMRPICDPEHLLFLQNTLISYQPSEMHLLGERAILHRRLGNFKSALADLKRYFAFHDRDKAPLELRVLHAELVELLERNKTSIEVLE